MQNSKKYIAVVCVLFIILAGLVVGLSRNPHATYTDSRGAVYGAVLNILANQKRVIEGESSLVVNDLLTKAAEMKARDLVTKGYFAHTSPDGKAPWYWISRAGYDFDYAGENLAVNFSESEDIVNAWMNSMTHRANVLRREFSEFGTAVATGTYNGVPATFVVQMYAHPRTR